MTETDWKILERLYDNTLTWGAAVGECWPTLARHGYVIPNFGDITPAGKEAVELRRVKKEVDDPSDDWTFMDFREKETK